MAAVATTTSANSATGRDGSGAAFDRAILRFSEAYAEQNERDYAALVTAVKSGRVTAETGA